MSNHLSIPKLIVVVFACVLAGVALVGCSSSGNNNDDAKEDSTEHAASSESESKTESQAESEDTTKDEAKTDENGSSQVASTLTLKTSAGTVSVDSASTYDDFKAYLNELDDVVAQTVDQTNKAKAPSNEVNKNVGAYSEARVPILAQQHQLTSLETIVASAHKEGSITADEYLKLDRKLDYYAEDLDEALDDLRLRMGVDDY